MRNGPLVEAYWL